MLGSQKSLGAGWYPLLVPRTIFPHRMPGNEWCLTQVRSSRSPKILQKFAFLAWGIWKEGNAVVFDKQIFNPVTCLIRAKKAYTEWRIRTCMSDELSQRGPTSSPSKKLQLVRWPPPPPGFIKNNFDGSLIRLTATGGYIPWDWIGKVIKTGAANYGQSSILVAEARALRDAVQVANQAGCTRLCIKATTT